MTFASVTRYCPGKSDACSGGHHRSRSVHRVHERRSTSVIPETGMLARYVAGHESLRYLSGLWRRSLPEGPGLKDAALLMFWSRGAGPKVLRRCCRTARLAVLYTPITPL